MVKRYFENLAIREKYGIKPASRYNWPYEVEEQESSRFVSPSVYVWFVLGLVALVVGAELLVRGASGLARALGISSLVVGLTVVSFGTSAPELSISLLSLLQGQADLSVGNVVGSNIANILLILGSAALVAPLVVSAQLIRLDVPIMILATLVVFFIT